MIDITLAEDTHNKIIDKTGGSRGIRDKGGLLAALARPYATFDLHELYPTPVEKAAALFESLIINHPFIDGNKRIAYSLMRLTLMAMILISLPRKTRSMKWLLQQVKAK